MRINFRPEAYTIDQIANEMYVKAAADSDEVMDRSKKTFTFDNPCQRKLCWNAEKDSLFMLSMLQGIPVNPIWAITRSKQRDVIDGKQRCHALYNFIKGKYALTLPVHEQEITQRNVKKVNINGMYFSDLPDVCQKEILGRSLKFYVLDEKTTQAEIYIIFARINFGKSLSTIELFRNMLPEKTRNAFSKIADNTLFPSIFTNKELDSFKDTDAIIRTANLFYGSDRSLKKDNLVKVVPYLTVTGDQCREMEAVFNKMSEVCKELKKYHYPYKKIFKVTHFVNIAEIVRHDLLKPVQDQADPERMAVWLGHFYSSDEKGMSISAVYNNYTSQGSAAASSIDTRTKILKNAYVSYFEKGESLPALAQDKGSTSKTQEAAAAKSATSKAQEATVNRVKGQVKK